jgi:hypothetical protein
VAAAEVVDLDLFEHFGAAEQAGSLLYDLDGILDVGEDVLAGLDPAVAALAQQLPGQLVQVLEEKNRCVKTKENVA